MDPLSVAASVVGLLTTAGKIVSLLELLASARQAPETIQDAQLEVKHTASALRLMERYLHRLEPVSRHRSALIQIDELRVTLADAMLTFSEFDSLLQWLMDMHKMRVAITWARYSKKIDEHLAKIQRYKTSLTLMLGILQCESDLEASQSQARLQSLVEEVLSENKKLKRLLLNSEDFFDARSTFTRRLEDDFSIRYSRDEDRHRNSNPLPMRNAAISRRSTVKSSVRSSVRGVMSALGSTSFAFENILQQSWVYQRNEHYECDASFSSSVPRSHAWSAFTGYTLADISVLSVIAMPLTRQDITNGQYYEVNLRDDQSSIRTIQGNPAPCRDSPELLSTHVPSPDQSDSDDNFLDLSDEEDLRSVSSDDIDSGLVYSPYTFQSAIKGHVSITQGDSMILLDDTRSYWWKVRDVKTSVVGYVPAEYVELPTERLARRNKQRNKALDESEQYFEDVAKRRQRGKTVSFETTPICIGCQHSDAPSEDEKEVDLSDLDSDLDLDNGHLRDVTLCREDADDGSGKSTISQTTSQESTTEMSSPKENNDSIPQVETHPVSSVVEDGTSQISGAISAHDPTEPTAIKPNPTWIRHNTAATALFISAGLKQEHSFNWLVRGGRLKRVKKSQSFSSWEEKPSTRASSDASIE